MGDLPPGAAICAMLVLAFAVYVIVGVSYAISWVF